jgi:hypothetical protein
VAASWDDGRVIGVIIIAVLAVGFVVLLWVRSAGAGNEGESLGNNMPYPREVFGPSRSEPPAGTPESLESHHGAEWADDELRRERHQDHTHPV